MAKNNQSKLASKRAKEGMKEVLVEGAASMSGQAAKEIAGSLIGGAIGEATAQRRKIRNKLKRKQFLQSLRGKNQKPQKLKEDITVEPVIYGGYDYKDSGFKMKGFSGFGNKE